MSLRNQLKKLDLGMSRKAVSLVPHNGDWLKVYSLIEATLTEHLSCDIKLHHIGSTSIPGIHAKPILDILGVVPSIEGFEHSRSELESFGFIWKGEYGIKGRRYGVLNDESNETNLIHLHVFSKSDREVEKHLLFRDYLRTFADAAKRYEELKKKLVAAQAENRVNYSEGKSELIVSLIDEAMKWKK